MSLRNSQDDRLGLNDPISRRDFLNGALLASAGLLLHGNAPPISPADAFDGYGGIGDYRHSNGNIWDVLRAGHAMRDGAFERRRSEEHTSELQSQSNLVCRLLLEKKKKHTKKPTDASSALSP